MFYNFTQCFLPWFWGAFIKVLLFESNSCCKIDNYIRLQILNGSSKLFTSEPKSELVDWVGHCKVPGSLNWPYWQEWALHMCRNIGLGQQLLMRRLCHGRGLSWPLRLLKILVECIKYIHAPCSSGWIQENALNLNHWWLCLRVAVSWV